MSVSESNSEQAEYWNEVAGPKWVRIQPRLDQQMAGIGRHTLDAAALRPGERVLDVGCGCGDHTLEAARRVSPDGSALGVDLSGPMLARARERATEAGLVASRFLQADAQVHSFEASSFDVVTSRFGVMFFADPVAAFANLLRALAPGGRLVFVCWQPLANNDWMRIPVAAAAAHVPLPPRPEPGAPGPFSLGEPDHLLGILRAAGFASPELSRLEEPMPIGGGLPLEAAAEFLLNVGPTGRMLLEAAADQIEAVRRAVVEAVAPFADASGVQMPSAAWIAQASRPSSG